MSDESKSLDVLGISGIGDSAKIVTQASVDGAEAFLSRICLPAAEELGLMIKDQVSNWRKQNLVRLAKNAEKKKKKYNHLGKQANPRLINIIIQKGSWIDNEDLQDMWAGLLASSCTKGGLDDSNIIFTTLLDQLTSVQAKILNFICENVKKKKTGLHGLITMEQFIVNINQLVQIAETTDIHRIDSELDHLRSLELIQIGFDLDAVDEKIDLTPTSLALNFYTRCQGSLLSAVEFFGIDNEMKNITKASE